MVQEVPEDVAQDVTVAIYQQQRISLTLSPFLEAEMSRRGTESCLQASKGCVRGGEIWFQLSGNRGGRRDRGVSLEMGRACINEL